MDYQQFEPSKVKKPKDISIVHSKYSLVLPRIFIFFLFTFFSAEDMMIDEFDYVQNIHSSAFYSYMATTRWFGVYLDWIVVIYLACCVLSFLLMPGDVLGN